VKRGIVVNDRVKYWIDLAESDLAAAKLLLSGDMLLHVAFNCHQAVEKALKAVIAWGLPEDEIPPKIHNLVMLASNASIKDKLSGEQKLLLRKLNSLNIESRYPDFDTPSMPTKEICEKVVREVEDFLCWIKKQL
jgi:HEPN domain-containing protein